MGTQHYVFPFIWKKWNGNNEYYDVEFTENFGTLKKGDKFDCVEIGISIGTIYCCTESKTISQDFKAIPID